MQPGMGHCANTKSNFARSQSAHERYQIRTYGNSIQIPCNTFKITNGQFFNSYNIFTQNRETSVFKKCYRERYMEPLCRTPCH